MTEDESYIHLTSYVEQKKNFDNSQFLLWVTFSMGISYLRSFYIQDEPSLRLLFLENRSIFRVVLRFGLTLVLFVWRFYHFILKQFHEFLMITTKHIQSLLNFTS